MTPWVKGIENHVGECATSVEWNHVRCTPARNWNLVWTLCMSTCTSNLKRCLSYSGLTDCVAKGNTLTLIGNQYLVWKDFILVGDEKKNPTVHTSKLCVCKKLYRTRKRRYNFDDSLKQSIVNQKIKLGRLKLQWNSRRHYLLGWSFTFSF